MGVAMADFGLRKPNGEWFIGINIYTQSMICTGDPFNTNILFMNLVQTQKLLYKDFPKKQEKNKYLVDFEIVDRKCLIDDRVKFIKQQALAAELLTKKQETQIETTPEVVHNTQTPG
jgi:hypothetical protein